MEHEITPLHIQERSDLDGHLFGGALAIALVFI